jgi:hypothetical protein
MSIKQKVVQLRGAIEQFSNLPFDQFFANPPQFPEWDGLSVEEFEALARRIRSLLTAAVEKDVFAKLPFVHVNGIHQTLVNSNSYIQSALVSKDFGQFQQASAQLDSLGHLMYAYGVVVEIEGLDETTKARQLYESEAAKLVASNIEVGRLTNDVKALISPAVSGSLSTAFSKRVQSLFWTRVVWGGAALILGAWGLVEAFGVVKELKEFVSKPTTDFWATFAVRSLVLVPIYLGFGFVLSQYKKERDFEEEYAHKAAISISLPNYRDLAKDDNVKDQLASEAAKVIFSPPTKERSKETKAVPLISSVRELVDSVSKAVKKD